jgi:hypothetical protein
MDEARLIRFGAGKTHLGAAFHAQRLLVEIILGFVLWHTPNRVIGWWAKGPTSASSGKQPELARHRPDNRIARALQD